MDKQGKALTPLELMWKQNNDASTVFLIASFVVLCLLLALLAISWMRPSETRFYAQFFFAVVLLGIALILFQLRSRAAACANSCLTALALSEQDPEEAKKVLSQSECLKNADRIISSMFGQILVKAPQGRKK